MMNIRKYTADDKALWNTFVESSKNGTFLHKRDYMEYHSDRFEDHSLLFLSEKNKVVALLPANIKDDILYSHQGLTYGGLILSAVTSLNDVMEMFDILKAYMSDNGISSLLYKQIPSLSVRRGRLRTVALRCCYGGVQYSHDSTTPYTTVAKSGEMP